MNTSTPTSATSPDHTSPVDTSRDANSRPTHTLLATLIRRELWEHRVLWMAPAIVAAILVVCAVPAQIGFVNAGFKGPSAAAGGVSWDYRQAEVPLDHEQRIGLFALAQWGLTLPLFLVMTTALYFYLLDCLYAERKDRSILFWKSLPVSDAATVGSKLLVALVVIPLGVFVLTVVTNLLFSGIWNLREAFGHSGPHLVLWDTAAFLKVETIILLGLVASILWYAPVAAYLLLVSAWARRNVFLWTVLPPFIVLIVERLAFGTHFVSGLLKYRLGGLWPTLHLRKAIQHESFSSGHGWLGSVMDAFDAVDLRLVFANIDVWLGLVAAAALAFAATRIRRYRDDT